MVIQEESRRRVIGMITVNVVFSFDNRDMINPNLECDYYHKKGHTKDKCYAMLCHRKDMSRIIGNAQASVVSSLSVSSVDSTISPIDNPKLQRGLSSLVSFFKLLSMLVLPLCRLLLP